MKILRIFSHKTRGSLIQAMIALVIMGGLSYSFWRDWQDTLILAGARLKNQIESDQWLSE